MRYAAWVGRLLAAGGVILEPGPDLAALASLLWSLRFCLVAEGEGRMANLIGLVRSLLRAFPGGVYFVWVWPTPIGAPRRAPVVCLTVGMHSSS